MISSFRLLRWWDIAIVVFCLCLYLCFRFKVKLLSLYLTAISNQNLKQTSVSIVISGLKEEVSQGTKLISWPRQRFRVTIQLQKRDWQFQTLQGQLLCLACQSLLRPPWSGLATRIGFRWQVSDHQEYQRRVQEVINHLLRLQNISKNVLIVGFSILINHGCKNILKKKTFCQMSPHYQPWLQRNTNKKKYSVLDFPSLSTRVAKIRQYKKITFEFFISINHGRKEIQK